MVDLARRRFLAGTGATTAAAVLAPLAGCDRADDDDVERGGGDPAEGAPRRPRSRSTPPSTALSTGIVCVEVEGTHAGSLVEPLREAGFGCGTTPYQPSYLRFGPSIVTRLDEVDGLLAALADLV